jgi:hypothetical protein
MDFSIVPALRPASNRVPIWSVSCREVVQHCPLTPPGRPPSAHPTAHYWGSTGKQVCSREAECGNWVRQSRRSSSPLPPPARPR